MILLLHALLGCSDEASAPRWRLVSAYDLTSAVVALGAEEPAFTWEAAPGMNDACGVPKGANGLGVIEAQAIGDGLTSALALVLERAPGTSTPPTRHNLRVAIGDGRPMVPLQPAVAPRSLAVDIHGVADLRYQQLVRTQLQMEMCLEHKVGRGWIGGSGKALRQAFLLDPPERGGDDRLYFAGQRDAVPALLGAPDACIRMDGAAPRPTIGAPGEGSLALVPSDVWGAWIRPCNVAETPGAPARPFDLPFTATGGREPLRFDETRVWDGLDVEVSGGPSDADVRVTARWNGITVVADRPLFPEEQASGGGMVDLLARVPYAYPTFGPADDPDRYALLIVPNWQIVEALRRLGSAEGHEAPAPDAGDGVTDGVGWLLAHPRFLFVQTPSDETAADERYTWVEPSPTTSWSNLADALSGGRGAQPWGYTVAGDDGSGPIVVPGRAPASARVFAAAHRARFQSQFLLAAWTTLVIAALGLRRLRDLWVAIPDERVDYWPDASPPPRAAPSASGGEGAG